MLPMSPGRLGQVPEVPPTGTRPRPTCEHVHYPGAATGGGCSIWVSWLLGIVNIAFLNGSLRSRDVRLNFSGP
jgi:hypothetical protein